MSLLFIFPLKDNIYRIVDGDTLQVSLDRGFNETKEVYLRFSGLNSPETRTRRVLEKEAGLLVNKITEYWLNLIKGSQLYCTSEENPKFANRIIGRLWATSAEGWPWMVEPTESCLNNFLLELKVVKPYSGGKREFSDEELQEIINNCNSFLKQHS